MVQSSRPRLILFSGGANGLDVDPPLAPFGFVDDPPLVPDCEPVLGEDGVPLPEDVELPVSMTILVLLHLLA